MNLLEEKREPKEEKKGEDDLESNLSEPSTDEVSLLTNLSLKKQK